MTADLRPETAAEAADMVAGAYHAGHTLALRGAGTRAGRSSQQARILTTEALDRVTFFEPDDMVLGAETGIPFQRLRAQAAAAGMDLPVTPWFAGATLGGMAATDSWGAERLCRGGIRDLIIGIHYVDDQGRAVKSGGKVVKNVTGYDLAKMMTGSRGGLGLITALHLKMVPARLNPQRAVFHMRSAHWREWLCRDIHLKGLPLDWLQVHYHEGLWKLGLGFSGNALKIQRMTAEIHAAFDGETRFCPDQDAGPGAAWCGPSVRCNGFLSPILATVPNPYHLFLIAPTGAMLGKDRLCEALTAIPGGRVVWHPIGGDAHLIGDAALLTEAHVDQLRRALVGTGGHLFLERAPETHVATFGMTVPLPGAYPLQQALKRHLDPRGVFHAPFYDQV